MLIPLTAAMLPPRHAPKFPVNLDCKTHLLPFVDVIISAVPRAYPPAKATPPNTFGFTTLVQVETFFRLFNKPNSDTSDTELEGIRQVLYSLNMFFIAVTLSSNEFRTPASVF